MSEDIKNTEPQAGEPVPDSENETSEVFTRDYVQKLREENKKWRTQLRELEAWRESQQAEANKRKEQELAEQGNYKQLLEQRESELSQLKAQIEAQNAAMLRQRIAVELGIPAALAERLRGDNEEDLRKDAKTLLGALPVQPAPEPEQKPATTVERQTRTTTTSAVPGGQSSVRYSQDDLRRKFYGR